MIRPRSFLLALVVAAGLGGAASAQPAYTVNGVPATPEVTAMFGYLGLPPGPYRYDLNSGWLFYGANPNPIANLHGGALPYQSPLGGSGQTNPDGSWSYYSPYGPPGGVGQDSDGCYYVEGWSNC